MVVEGVALVGANRLLVGLLDGVLNGTLGLHSGKSPWSCLPSVRVRTIASMLPDQSVVTYCESSSLYVICRKHVEDMVAAGMSFGVH